MESVGGEVVEVDEVNGVIRNVLVLGRRSPNTPMQSGRPMQGVTDGTSYTDAAFQSAARVMEGAKVRKNHPDRRSPNAERDVEDGLGVFRDCRPTPSGVRADFHYNRQHPFNAQLIEDVKRRMGQWGFSPNAVGVGAVKNGVYVVEEIVHVRSVDLVSDPATTVNLWESRHMAYTVADHFESVLPRLKGRERVVMARFMENMGGPGDPLAYKKADVAEEDPAAPPATLADTPMEEPPAEGGDPMEAISAGFATALKALVDGVMSGDMAADEAINKFKELIKTHDKLLSGGSGSAPTVEDTATVEEGEDEDAKEEKEKGEVEEGKNAAAKVVELERKLAAYTAKEQVVQLCEQLDFKASPEQLLAIADIQESRRRPFLLSLKALASRPVSMSAHRINLAKPDATAADQSAAAQEKFFRDGMAILGRVATDSAN